jgi:hypothetical protein
MDTFRFCLTTFCSGPYPFCVQIPIRDTRATIIPFPRIYFPISENVHLEVPYCGAKACGGGLRRGTLSKGLSDLGICTNEQAIYSAIQMPTFVPSNLKIAPMCLA